MRLGVYVAGAGSTLEEMIGQACAAAEAGLDSAFFSQLTAWDTLTVAALAGQRVPGIELGTAVVQTYPRHPLVLAGQALTAQAATGNRVTLGVGPSHRHSSRAPSVTPTTSRRRTPGSTCPRCARCCAASTSSTAAPS